MKKMGLHEARKEFLDFFEKKGHLIQDSYSLVPMNDPSILIVGAGMAPLKKYFTGELVPPRTRMATCQKCMRTGDLENVGKTARHATFFEMLGNFSFGDYFKREAIEWAWEFLTVNCEMDPEDLWVSVYLDDDEAHNIWRDEIGVPEEKIVRLGKEDNFWELEVGPSGPCSEIHVDRGPEFGCGDPDCKPGCECDRFLEVWNLVFTQFDKDEQGVYHPLSNPNIDTGMGLERLVAVLEGADNIFEIEAVQDIIKKIEEVSAYKYHTDEEKDMSVRVITDHVRAMTFMASDMIIPSNEGRGYVMRRIIRRAARHGRLLGIEESFLSKIAQVVIDSWSVSYKDLKKNQDRILSVIETEEKRFEQTIDKGIAILDAYIDELEETRKTILSGKDAFKLYDTYGFPLDLTREILEEKGYSVDEEEFATEMEAQRIRARSASQAGEDSGWHSQKGELEIEGAETDFLGYVKTSTGASVVNILRENQEVEFLEVGEAGVIILDKTSFYGEGGGQLGDTGVLKGENFEFLVEDTQKTSGGIVLHIGRLESGELKIGDGLEAQVNINRRKSIVRNHSATHLLHAALRKVLGDHVQQGGSEVGEKSFRFDFSHYEAVSKSQLKEIEEKVNDYIYSETPAEIYEVSIEEAYEEGAIGLFEDKYKDKVRIVNFPEISKELCGGTHVEKTSDIGIFKILSEGGIASGVRRIEATTGKNVYEYLLNLEERETQVLATLKTTKDNVIDKAKSILEENKKLEKEIGKLKKSGLQDDIEGILDDYQEIEGIKIIKARIDNQDVSTLRDLADQVRDKAQEAVVVLGTVKEDKVNFVATVSKSLIPRGLHAGKIVKEVSTITKGGGGGRPDMATAGGKDINKLDEALNSVYDIIKNLL